MTTNQTATNLKWIKNAENESKRCSIGHSNDFSYFFFIYLRIVLNSHHVGFVIAFSARFILYINLVRFLLFCHCCCCSIGVVYNVHLFVYLFKFFGVFNISSLPPSFSVSLTLHFFCLICNAFLVIHGAWNAFMVKCEQRKEKVSRQACGKIDRKRMKTMSKYWYRMLAAKPKKNRCVWCIEETDQWADKQ